MRTGKERAFLLALGIAFGVNLSACSSPWIPAGRSSVWSSSSE